MLPERCSSDHLVLSWWCSHTPLTWYNSGNDHSRSKEIPAKSIPGAVGRTLPGHATALPQPLGYCCHLHRWSALVQPMLTGHWGAPRSLFLPREALRFPETRNAGRLAAKLPFLGKSFHMESTLVGHCFQSACLLMIPCCVCSLISK